MKIRNTFTRKIPLLILTLLATLIGSSYATTTAPVQTSTVQSLNGVLLHITGAFSMTSFGLNPTSNVTAATNPCSWSLTNCNTVLFAGDWQLAVSLSLNKAPAAFTTYAITVGAFGTCETSCPQPMYPLARSIQFTVTPQDIVNTLCIFTFDTGTIQIPQNASFTITIQ